MREWSSLHREYRIPKVRSDLLAIVMSSLSASITDDWLIQVECECPATQLHLSCPKVRSDLLGMGRFSVLLSSLSLCMYNWWLANTSEVPILCQTASLILSQGQIWPTRNGSFLCPTVLSLSLCITDDWLRQVEWESPATQIHFSCPKVRSDLFGMGHFSVLLSSLSLRV